MQRQQSRSQSEINVRQRGDDESREDGGAVVGANLSECERDSVGWEKETETETLVDEWEDEEEKEYRTENRADRKINREGDICGNNAEFELEADIGRQRRRENTHKTHARNQ